MIAHMNHVEARLAGRKLDHRFLPLLLLRDLLRLDLDTGQFGEFLDVLLQIVAARPFGKDHFQFGAGVFLPLRLGGLRGQSRKGERARGG